MDLYQNTFPGRGSQCFEVKCQQGDYFGDEHGCPLWEKGVLDSIAIYYADGMVHWN